MKNDFLFPVRKNDSQSLHKGSTYWRHATIYSVTDHGDTIGFSFRYSPNWGAGDRFPADGVRSLMKESGVSSVDELVGQEIAVRNYSDSNSWDCVVSLTNEQYVREQNAFLKRRFEYDPADRKTYLGTVSGSCYGQRGRFDVYFSETSGNIEITHTGCNGNWATGTYKDGGLSLDEGLVTPFLQLLEKHNSEN